MTQAIDPARHSLDITMHRRTHREIYAYVTYVNTYTHTSTHRQFRLYITYRTLALALTALTMPKSRPGRSRSRRDTAGDHRQPQLARNPPPPFSLLLTLYIHSPLSLAALPRPASIKTDAYCAYVNLLCAVCRIRTRTRTRTRHVNVA